MDNHKQGFSLVEILVALLILGVGLTLVYNLFPLGWQSFAYSHKLNDVSLFVQRKMEEIKANKGAPGNQTSGTEGDFRWTVVTEPVKVENDTSMTYLELDVEFTYQSKPQQERFVTYLSD